MNQTPTMPKVSGRRHPMDVNNQTLEDFKMCKTPKMPKVSRIRDPRYKNNQTLNQKDAESSCKMVDDVQSFDTAMTVLRGSDAPQQNANDNKLETSSVVGQNFGKLKARNHGNLRISAKRFLRDCGMVVKDGDCFTIKRHGENTILLTLQK